MKVKVVRTRKVRTGGRRLRGQISGRLEHVVLSGVGLLAEPVTLERDEIATLLAALQADIEYANGVIQLCEED